MDKAFGIQKQIRDNAKTVHSYLTDLQNWELEMKRKEAALNGQFEQVTPPIRSKARKEKPVQLKKKQDKRILSSDYKAWEKFDVDKACEEVDMEGMGPVSLDSKKSQSTKQEKLREEAQYEKERGNVFVKQEKWDEAIACYNRAIELVEDDAIYYANRGLCYLKKDSLDRAESDCSAALRLDPTYVKALQRRAAARARGAGGGGADALRGAAADLARALQLEPRNGAAAAQLREVRARLAAQGLYSKSSPSPTPTVESKPTSTNMMEVDEPIATAQVDTAVDNWRDGVGENITVIKPVKKPPHLRSKQPLKSIPIHEIQLGKTTTEKPPTRLKIVEIQDELSNVCSADTNKSDNSPERLSDGKGDNDASPESMKLVHESIVNEKKIKSMVPPVTSVQFMAQWKYLKGNEDARSDYLSIIDPVKIPSIFANALESEVLSDVLQLLHAHPHKFSPHVCAYLRGMCHVKRFSALAMFLSSSDKQNLSILLEHCKTVEKCSDEVIADLKMKYEL